MKYAAEGRLPADRTEVVRSAMVYMLQLLVASKGVDFETLEKISFETDAIKVKEYVPPTPEELRRRQQEKCRAAHKEYCMQRGMKRV